MSVLKLVKLMNPSSVRSRNHKTQDCFLFLGATDKSGFAGLPLKKLLDSLFYDKSQLGAKANFHIIPLEENSDKFRDGGRTIRSP